MIARSLTIVAWVVFLFQYGAAAAQTWPSSVDELEDIMFLNTGYRARGFAQAVTPCTSEGAEGFISAAQWLRLAFHDVGTANTFTGIGGLDASIVFEMGSSTNSNPGLNASIEQFAPFFSTRSSMSDLIALGVYTAVRGCGGPVVAIRGGRVDATAAGPDPDVFLPIPQNSLFIFESQFQRLGFSTTQMIAVVACGHTLGQVHVQTFPQIATAGTKPLDSTPAVFDQNIASQYVAGTSSDLMVVGTNAAFNSDLRVFSADKNVTITSMAQPATFNSMCSAVLQQMIEVVPSGVVLTDPIVPYDVKPYAAQLTLLNGGTAFSFTGEIRVRTTNFQASRIASVQLAYMDRSGGSNCGGGSCTISSSYKGSSAGFDDSFVFYGFSAQIPTDTSISAFNVVITFTGGATELYNNNGPGFPVQDTIMLQSSESCLTAPYGINNLIIVAAVRNTVTSPTVNLTLTQNVPVAGLGAPTLQTTSVTMAFQSAIGNYNLYAATSSVNIYQLQNTNIKFDVSVGAGSGKIADSFKNTNQLPSVCGTLSSSASSTSLASSTSTLSTTTSSPGPTTSAPPGWATLGCYTDGVNGGRTLRNGEAVPGGAPAMTIELCVAACKAAGFSLAGVEYGQECWCDNTLNSGGGPAPDGDIGCNMSCKGNALETCGGSNRLDMYIAGSSSSPTTTATTSTTSTTSTTTSTTSTTTSTTSTVSASATASAPAGWTALGCFADNVNGGRTLQNGEAVPGGAPAMTVDLCVAACQAAGFVLAGVEYSQECWCDNTLNNGGGPAPDGNVSCSMPCRGNAAEMCGGPNRLNMYSLGTSSTNPTTTSTSSTIFTTSTTSTTSSTLTTTSTSKTSATSSSSSSSSSPLSSTPPSTSKTSAPSTTTSKTFTISTSSTTSKTSTTSTSSTTFKASITSSTSKTSTTSTTSQASKISTTPSTSKTSATTTISPTSSLSSTSQTSTTSTTFTASTTSTTATTATMSAPAGWTALGCYADNVNNVGRTLRNNEAVTGGSSAMTIELCVAACKNAGFILAGVEYGQECWCDNTFNNGGGPALDGSAGCNIACLGSSLETCGGPNRLDVYKVLSYTPVTNPTIQGYMYQGCYNEPAGGRALTASSTASDSMTVESCAAFCNGAVYFGTEYGRECYCGPSIPATSTLQPATDCSFTCSGNSYEYCGAGSRLSLYKHN